MKKLATEILELTKNELRYLEGEEIINKKVKQEK
jgi:hypothetical protein